jgi:hypothetical protein
MESLHNYFEIIDTIRKDNRFTINEVCKGIISERSYYRYIKKEKKISYEILTKLINRMNIDFMQFLIYVTFFHKDDSAIVRFPYRVQTYNFDDIDIYYEKIKEEKVEQYLPNELIGVYIKRYEYIINEITKGEYIAYLEETIDGIYCSKRHGIYKNCIESFYLLEAEEQSIVNIDKVVAEVVNADMHENLLYYFFTLDNLISVIMMKYKDRFDLFSVLIEILEKIIEVIPITFMNMKFYIFQAYKYLIQKDTEKMDEYLFEAACVMCYYGGEAYRKTSELLRRVFNKEPEAIIGKVINKMKLGI